MKQHNTYNDEELYQQIVAELQPAADEYDALMAAGKAPASKSKVVAMHETHTSSHRRNAYIYKYVAAACVTFAIIGTSLGIFLSNDTETTQPVAEVVKPTDNNQQNVNTLLVHEEAKEPVSAESIKSAEHIQLARSAKAIESNKLAESVASADDADEAEQAFLYALITEVENEALAEQAEEESLYRSIIEEVTANMSNKSNKPELVL
ncbi:MAG: hypothetical protein KBT33_13395 [Prevotellaceae bacterium]|nr:hypothetical protein [Candidatus Minthosoma equi]